MNSKPLLSEHELKNKIQRVSITQFVKGFELKRKNIRNSSNFSNFISQLFSIISEAILGNCVDKSVLSVVQQKFKLKSMNLYYLPPSPPCRAVLLMARILGIDLNLKTLNITEGEHMKKDFLELNPTHTIPTLEITENGLVLWESRVILTYLVAAFGKSEHDSLYPKEVNKRAIVDLYLQFDLSTLYQRTLEHFFPTIIMSAPLEENKKARLVEALGFFEAMLKSNKKFCTGDDFTVADLALCVTISQIEAFGFDMRPYPRIRKWFNECKTELSPYGYDEINSSGAETLAAMFRSKLKP